MLPENPSYDVAILYIFCIFYILFNFTLSIPVGFFVISVCNSELWACSKLETYVKIMPRIPL